jgi:ribA/ribD-fused uncharacterized protein
MNYSIDKLTGEIEEGLEPEYLFFWDYTQKKAGVIDKSCFSQWYPAAFAAEGIEYATAEHWMMYKKALLFKDEKASVKILAAEKPAVAKALGREVKNFDAGTWNEVAYSLVIQGNKHKFEQHPQLLEFLLNTKDKIMVEASPADTVWGIGLTQDHPNATNPFKWKGTNLLGFALMEVRDILKQ